MKQSQWQRWVIACILLLATATGHAAEVIFGGETILGCTLSGKTYDCPSYTSAAADIITIADGYSVVGDLDQGASARLLKKASLIGNLTVTGAVTRGVEAKIEGNLTSSDGTVTLDSYAEVTGNLYAGTTVTSADHAIVRGNVTALETVTMAASSHVFKNVTGTTVTMAANGIINGDVSATTVSLAANATIEGDVKEATTVSLAANATIEGDVKDATTVSVAAGGCVEGDVSGTTVTLAAGGGVGGSVDATLTVTLAQGASVGKNVNAGTTFTMTGDSTVGGYVTVAGGTRVEVNGYGQQDGNSCNGGISRTIIKRQWRQIFMR